jgi:hypothetical protein
VTRAVVSARGDPLVEVRCLGTDGRGLAVAGVHHRVAWQQASRIDSVIVGKSEYERPVAPGPPVSR